MASSSKSRIILRRKGPGIESPHETEAVVHILIVEVGNQKEKNGRCVFVIVFQAVSIPAGDKSGTSDAYCRASIGKEKGKTRTIHSTLRCKIDR